MSATDSPREPDDRPPDAIFFGPRPGYGGALWAVIAMATVAFTLLKSWQLGLSAWGIATGIAFIATAGAAMLPRGDRLGSAWAWGAAMTSALLAQFATMWDPAHGRIEGYALWYVRGATIVCAVVILRHRAGAGWTGALVTCSAPMIVSALAAEPFALWAGVAVRQAAALIALQAFAILLARGQEAIAALREEERARLTAIQLRETVMKQRHLEAERIRRLVTATLQRIATEQTNAELRREAMLCEGELRDALRGRRLAAGPVPAAVRAARARGTDMVLLDDLGESHEASASQTVPASALAWVASRVSAVEAPRATVRLAAGAERRPVISFYAESPDGRPEFLTLGPAEPRSADATFIT